MELGRGQIPGSILATLFDNVKGNALTFVQRTHSGTLDSADVYKNVFRSILGLNESKSFGSVEKFNCSDSHFGLP
jgi:hypothetical protein